AIAHDWCDLLSHASACEAKALGPRTVPRLTQTPRKHQQRYRLRSKRGKRPVRNETQFIEQRPMNDWAKLALAHEADHFLERDRRLQFHAHAGQEFRIDIHSLNSALYSPVRPLIPVGSSERYRAEVRRQRLDRFQKSSHLGPTLPVVPDVSHPIEF